MERKELEEVPKRDKEERLGGERQQGAEKKVEKEEINPLLFS